MPSHTTRRARRLLALLLVLALTLPAAAAAADPWAPVDTVSVADDAIWSFTNWRPVQLPGGLAARRPGRGESAAAAVFTGTSVSLLLAATQPTRFQYRIDGGPWQQAELPGDGRGTALRWVYLAQGLAAGEHLLELRPQDQTLTVLGLRSRNVPGPASAHAEENMGAVVVLWAPPPYPAPRYEVLRWVDDAASPEVVAETAALTFTDTEPPTGQALRYAVRARLADGRLSGLTTAGAVTVPAYHNWIRVSGMRGTATVEQTASLWLSNPLAVTGGPLANGLGLEGEYISMTLARALGLGDRLQPGDTIVVGDDGWLEIELAGQQYLRLDRGTRIDIARHQVDPVSGRQDTGFRATVGRLWVNLKQRLGADSRFEVETPTMVMGVRGTNWAIEVRPDGDTETWATGGIPLIWPTGRQDDDPGQELLPGQRAALSATGLIATYFFAADALPEFVQVEAIKAWDDVDADVRDRLAAAVPDKLFDRALGELLAEEQQRLELERREQERSLQHGTEQALQALSPEQEAARQRLEDELQARVQQVLQQVAERLQQLTETFEQRREERAAQRDEAREREEQRRAEERRQNTPPAQPPPDNGDSTPAPDPSDPVQIPDPVLAAAVRDALDKAYNEEITVGDMASLTGVMNYYGDILDLTGIEYAVNLTTLYLLGSGTVELDVTPLTDLPALSEVTISGYTLRSIARLAELTGLTYLSISDADFTDLTVLSNLHNLETLDLGRNGLSDLTPLAGLTGLVALHLNHNDIADLSPLQGLGSLQALWLRDNQINDLTPLAALTGLSLLDVSENFIFDITPLTQLVAAGGFSEPEGMIDLSYNFLNLHDPAVATQIADLGSHGITVYDSPQKPH